MKPIALLLAVLLAVPAPAAKTPRGARIKLDHSSGRYRGELLSVTPEFIVLRDRKHSEYLAFPAAAVKKVMVRKSKAMTGVLVGLLTGAGLTGLVILTTPKKVDTLGEALGVAILAAVAVAGAIVVTAFLTAGGGLVGSLFGWKRFKLGKMDALDRAEALRRLAAHARFGPLLPEELKLNLRRVN